MVVVCGLCFLGLSCCAVCVYASSKGCRGAEGLCPIYLSALCVCPVFVCAVSMYEVLRISVCVCVDVRHCAWDFLNVNKILRSIEYHVIDIDILH